MWDYMQCVEMNTQLLVMEKISRGAEMDSVTRKTFERWVKRYGPACAREMQQMVEEAFRQEKVSVLSGD